MVHVASLLARPQADGSVPALARERYAARVEECRQCEGRLKVVETKVLVWDQADRQSSKPLKLPAFARLGRCRYS